MYQDCSRVTVRGLTLDPVTSAPIVILGTEDGSRLLPIRIGLLEANAIAPHLEGVETPRPLTNDLLRDLISLLGAETVRVVVDAPEGGHLPGAGPRRRRRPRRGRAVEAAAGEHIARRFRRDGRRGPRSAGRKG